MAEHTTTHLMPFQGILQTGSCALTQALERLTSSSLVNHHVYQQSSHINARGVLLTINALTDSNSLAFRKNEVTASMYPRL